MPLAALALQQSDVDWKFTTTPQAHTRLRTHNWPRAKMLGGCSAMNIMLYVRGKKLDTRFLLQIYVNICLFVKVIRMIMTIGHKLAENQNGNMK